jgi:predicted RNase H-like HicB family nuclease
MSYQEIITAINGYPVIIEASADNYGAYSPDLPGCVAGADTYNEVIEAMREIIPVHLKALAQQGLPVPPPHPELLVEAQPADHTLVG